MEPKNPRVVETSVYSQLTRNTGNHLGLVLVSEVGMVLWDRALDLWDLLLISDGSCQNCTDVRHLVSTQNTHTSRCRVLV